MYFTAMIMRMKEMWDYVMFPTKYYARYYAKKYVREYMCEHSKKKK